MRAQKQRPPKAPSRPRAKTAVHFAIAGVIAAITPASPASASEKGLSHYPLGVSTVHNGVLPPPGTLQFYSYSQYYDADKVPGADGKSVIPDFHCAVAVEAPRLVYTYPISLGPFHLSSGVIPVMAHVSLNAAGHHSNVTGFGDLNLQLLYLSYANKSHNFFAYVGPDLFLPTGSYNRNRLANIGLNYATISPGLHLTWFPDKKTEFSASVIPELNWTNRATHYRSGNAINVDASLEYRPFTAAPKLRFAVQGYVHKQIEDDTISGHSVPGGFRGQAFAIGPQIEYDIFPRGGILFKYDREFDVRNRPRGNRFWVELATAVW